VWLVALCWGFVLFGAPAQAHRIGVSSVTLYADGQTVEGEVAVKGSDLETLIGIMMVDADLDVVRATDLEANADAAIAGILRHVTVVRGDGAACQAAADPPEVDEDGVLFWIVWDCGLDADPIVYRNTLFHDSNPLAIQNVLLHRGEEQIQDVLTSKYTELAVTAVPPPSLIEVFLRYVRSGISHIFIGYDHIAFLIALLLWARRAWPIVKVVTAFTIAHSITLALAVLDVVSLPSDIVEPLIAASIIWVAAENLFGQRLESRWRITFALGLVHGFGFAGVLREFGLPSDAIGIALAAFNIGVEIGQVAIVALAVPVLLIIDRIASRGVRSPALVRAASLMIAGLGLYWLVERTVLV
jgi:hydrogenase/urease accessory protein HupE